MRRPFGSLSVSLSAAGLVLALGLGACGSDDKKAGGGGSDAHGGDQLEDVEVIDGAEADVTVLDNTFNTENIQIAPGTKVVWTNDGRQDHDIVPVDGPDGLGVEPGDFNPDAVYEYTFDKPGTYRYYCSLHGTEDAGMIGAIVVKE
ncbi:MAG TPA: plastocyanin/azurin family copper-binding protein [Acidimicrobiales bacterium]|jgi:plastocyanin